MADPASQPENSLSIDISNQRKLQLNGVAAGSSIIVAYVPPDAQPSSLAVLSRAEPHPHDEPAPPADPSRYNMSAVRRLLTEAFDELELRQVCRENTELKDVTIQFAHGMDRRRMVDVLLDYCERYESMHKLLQIVRRRNPAKFQRYVEDLWQR